MTHLRTLQLLFVRGWTLQSWLQLLAPPTAEGEGLAALRRLEIPLYLGDEGLARLPAACGGSLEKLALHNMELSVDFRCDDDARHGLKLNGIDAFSA